MPFFWENLTIYIAEIKILREQEAAHKGPEVGGNEHRTTLHLR